jgi:hypothetical protein
MQYITKKRILGYTHCVVYSFIFGLFANKYKNFISSVKYGFMLGSLIYYMPYMINSVLDDTIYQVKPYVPQDSTSDFYVPQDSTSDFCTPTNSPRIPETTETTVPETIEQTGTQTVQ